MQSYDDRNPSREVTVSVSIVFFLAATVALALVKATLWHSLPWLAVFTPLGIYLVIFSLILSYIAFAFAQEFFYRRKLHRNQRRLKKRISKLRTQQMRTRHWNY